MEEASEGTSVRGFSDLHEVVLPKLAKAPWNSMDSASRHVPHVLHVASLSEGCRGQGEGALDQVSTAAPASSTLGDTVGDQ